MFGARENDKIIREVVSKLFILLSTWKPSTSGGLKLELNNTVQRLKVLVQELFLRGSDRKSGPRGQFRPQGPFHWCQRPKARMGKWPAFCCAA